MKIRLRGKAQPLTGGVGVFGECFTIGNAYFTVMKTAKRIEHNIEGVVQKIIISTNRKCD